MPYRSFNFLVSGKVQGVYFRVFAKGVAEEAGIVGWVANDTKGNVVGVAQGEEGALSKFQKALHSGPPLANVQTVRVENERALDTLEHGIFEVRRKWGKHGETAIE